MKRFIFILRPGIKPLTAEQVGQGSKQWRWLIYKPNTQVKLVAWQIFENKGAKVFGADRRIVDDHLVVENNESAGEVITINAKSFAEAVELSKLCPVFSLWRQCGNKAFTTAAQ